MAEAYTDLTKLHNVKFLSPNPYNGRSTSPIHKPHSAPLPQPHGPTLGVRTSPLSSDRQHLSYDGFLEVRGEIIRTIPCRIEEK